MKELNIPLEFNRGFKDAAPVGEEIYQCDIRGGEPTFEKVNPIKLRVYKSGYSNKIEDADMIAIEDYWSPGKIHDYFYEELSPKDRKWLEELPNTIASGATDGMDNYDERYGLVQAHMMHEEFELNDEDAKFIADVIKTHMGPWTTDYDGNEILVTEPRKTLDDYLEKYHMYG